MEHNTDRAGDLEVEDDGPDQTQGQLRVSICYVIISDVHQLDLGNRHKYKETQVRFTVAETILFVITPPK